MLLDAGGQTCSGCATRFPDAALACPSCHKLVHTEALRALSQEAGEAARAGDAVAELTAWRKALMLLPPASRQHGHVLERTRALSTMVEQSGAHAPGASGAAGRSNALQKGLAGATALGLLLWKFKALGLFVVTKLKFLLLGLTKANTLLSMLFAMGVYFTLWGWKFAVGFVLCMYVHEMGHVAALRRQGIPASAPMFIPGVGAFVRSAAYPTTPAENARIGLAGPIWGLGAAAACAAVFASTSLPIWGALARSAAYLNLFNLLPIFGLDGAHGFQALDKRQRLWATAALGAAWVMTEEGLLLVVAAVAAYRALATAPAATPDRRALFEYVGLVIALSWLMEIFVPVPGAV
jgi:Zn-dependent protease